MHGWKYQISGNRGYCLSIEEPMFYAVKTGIDARKIKPCSTFRQMAESWPQRSFSLFIFCQKEKFGLEGESLRLLDGFIYKGDSKKRRKRKEEEHGVGK